MTEARPEQRRVTISDPQVMRALAHPARLAIMEHLSSLEGGATATECAEIAGLSPSATSYHLRALAKFGLIEPAPSRGDARERVWRAFSPSYYIEPGRSAGSEARAAERALVEAHTARDAQRTFDWLDRAADEPPEWYAARLSNTLLLLTAEDRPAAGAGRTAAAGRRLRGGRPARGRRGGGPGPRGGPRRAGGRGPTGRPRPGGRPRGGCGVGHSDAIPVSRPSAAGIRSGHG